MFEIFTGEIPYLLLGFNQPLKSTAFAWLQFSNDSKRIQNYFLCINLLTTLLQETFCQAMCKGDEIGLASPLQKFITKEGFRGARGGADQDEPIEAWKTISLNILQPETHTFWKQS